MKIDCVIERATWRAIILETKINERTETKNNSNDAMRGIVCAISRCEPMPFAQQSGRMGFELVEGVDTGSSFDPGSPGLKTDRYMIWRPAHDMPSDASPEDFGERAQAACGLE